MDQCRAVTHYLRSFPKSDRLRAGSLFICPNSILGSTVAIVFAYVLGVAAQLLTADAVIHKFSQLDAAGAQLSEATSRELSALFELPSKPPRVIHVVRDDIVISPVIQHGDKADCYIESIDIGRIDVLTGKFSFAPPTTGRGIFQLVRADRRPDGREWTIAGTAPEPRVTVEVALRYMTKTRDETADPAMKQNAAATVTALSRLAPGK